MSCFHPIDVVRLEDGSVSFHPHIGQGDPFKIPCGQCMGCRIDRSKMWAVRCMHEASLYDKNCFVTLTYADEHLPPAGALVYEHYQKFMKRLRFAFKNQNIRFYMCGEYGEQNLRPHYHAILFNFDFPDKTLWKVNNGNYIYRSEKLEELWPYGHSSVGTATEQSAAYVARYVTKKVFGQHGLDPKTGEPYADRYLRADPVTGELVHVPKEFNRMSLKPGIAQAWFDKYYSDVYSIDAVQLRDGRRIKPPRYYDKKFDALEPYQFDAIRQDRIVRGLKHAENNTPERLGVRERVLLSKTKQLIRPIE